MDESTVAEIEENAEREIKATLSLKGSLLKFEQKNFTLSYTL
jgi:hypothetical protein